MTIGASCLCEGHGKPTAELHSSPKFCAADDDASPSGTPTLLPLLIPGPPSPPPPHTVHPFPEKSAAVWLDTTPET